MIAVRTLLLLALICVAGCRCIDNSVTVNVEESQRINVKVETEAEAKLEAAKTIDDIAPTLKLK